MKTMQVHPKFVAWLNAENMHEASKKWSLELFFIKDEQLFFDDLIKSYTLQLIDSKYFEIAKEIIAKISESHQKNKNLIEAVRIHEANLEVMVDGIDQLKEEDEYKDKHRELIILISEFFHNYQELKSELYALIKDIMKDQKQKHLLK